MGTLLDLANRMDALQEKVSVAASKAAIEVAKVVHQDLLNVTPVDTSKALSNWVVTVGEPWAVEIEAYRLGSQGSTNAASIAEALAQARQEYERKKPGESIFITNNASYIGELNEGSSSQAPVGFVQRSVLIGRKIAKSIRLKL